MSEKYDLIILDEINYAVNLGLINIESVVELIKLKPKKLDLVLTGNHAKKEIVELADLGATLQKGETFGTIESVKAVEEVYLPFSGKIISINENVVDNPEVLQNDPIGEGWLVILEPLSTVSLDDLMTSDEYKSKVVPK